MHVVIPTWDAARLLHLALTSLHGQAYPRWEVTVVDNGSTDDTVAMLRDQWPRVEIICLATNTGFAAAVNCGIRSGSAEFIALVNNDVELTPHWLSDMVKALTESSTAGSATGRMLSARDRDRIDNVGLYCDWAGVAGPAGRGTLDGAGHDRPAKIFGACAGAGLYRRTAFEAVGLFDEDFFAYVEDVDWAFRAQLRGYECVYVPEAVSFHLGGATGAKLGERFDYLCVRNTAVMILKNFPAWALLGHAPGITWQFGLMARAHAREGHIWVYVRALASVAASLKSVLSRRRGIQGSAKVDRAYLERVIRPGRPLLGRRRRG